MALFQAGLFMLAVLRLSSVQAMTPEAFMKMRFPNIVQPLPWAANNSNQTGNYSACTLALKKLTANPKALAVYIDATGKPKSGLREGNLAWYGSFDECTVIPEAHYCLANMFVDLKQLIPQPIPIPSLTIKWGLCVPKQCSETDVAFELYRLIHVFNISKAVFPVGFSPGASAVVCAAPSKYTIGVILTLTLCGIILLLCLAGTAVEVVENFLARQSQQRPGDTCGNIFCLNDSTKETDPKTVVNAEVVDVSDKENLVQTQPVLVESSKRYIVLEILLCFSLIRNTKRIMNTKVPAGAITSLNGMRVLSMWWVILGHTILLLFMSGNIINIKDAAKVLQRFTFQGIMNATVSVDSFFFLSGLLVSYLSLKEMDRRGGLPLFKFYFHRFWRLTPSYMFVILFYDKLMGFFGQGPMWFSQQQNPACDKYWWTNLLYINNFHPDSLVGECLAWSWYLANDMQFYIISPIILYAIYKFRLIGLVVSTAPLFVIQFIITGVLFLHYDLAAVGQTAHPTGSMEDLVYIKPYCRISVYLIGLAVGYLMHAQRGRTQRLPLVVVIAGWFLAVALGMLVVYGPYSVYKEGGTPFNMAENITYGTFSRTAWGLAIAWVIYACQNGYGGLVDSILSAQFWIPLSRLTYGAYLLHIPVLSVFIEAYTGTFAYSDVNYAFYFVGGVAISYAASFILAVCVEFPTMQLERVLFRSRDRDR